MNKELCERLVLELEQVGQKMGMDFYETMKKAPTVVERWKVYYLTAQEIWRSANNREEAVRFLESLPEPKPENFEKVLSFLQTLPYLLRGLLQDAAKALPPSPGGRPRGLRPEESRDVCIQIGQLYGEGVELAEAKRRMAMRYGVSLSTIQRAWKGRLPVCSVKRSNQPREEGFE